MLYAKSRKSFVVRREFFTLPCALIKHTAKHVFAVCQKKAHGIVWLCRVPKKIHFTVCYIFTVCAHGQELLCHVSDKKHTANYRTHGKYAFSRSGGAGPT